MPAKSPSERGFGEILRRVWLGGADLSPSLTIKEAKAKILALALEIVGEDERNFSRMGDKSTIQQLAAVERNKLRAELRAAFRKAFQ